MGPIPIGPPTPIPPKPRLPDPKPLDLATVTAGRDGALSTGASGSAGLTGVGFVMITAVIPMAATSTATITKIKSFVFFTLDTPLYDYDAGVPREGYRVSAGSAEPL